MSIMLSLLWALPATIDSSLDIWLQQEVPDAVYVLEPELDQLFTSTDTCVQT